MKAYKAIRSNINIVLATVLIVGFLIRVFATVFIKITSIPDADTYIYQGEFLFQNGYISSFKVMPLYPIINYLSRTIGNGSILDILFSTSSIMITFFLGKVLFSSIRIGLIASAMLAIYPFAIFYAGSETTETSYTFFILLGILFLYEKRILWASIALVLSILIRPSNDLINPILILVSTSMLHKSSSVEVLKNLVIYAICYIFLMMPWWTHNLDKYNDFVRLNLGLGEMVYGGNNDSNPEGRALDNKKVFKTFDTIQNPIKRDNALKAGAIQYIQENPSKFIETCISRILIFYNPIPNHEKYSTWQLKAISFISVFPLLLGVVLFFILADKSIIIKSIPILLFIGYITAIHSMTIASVRYRFPLEPFFILLSSYTYSSICNFMGLKR